MPKAVSPIRECSPAMPHRPLYRMHRYFARRPYSIFAELVAHYSDEHDVILDPFFGGGVTLVEAVLQNRRAIGCDTNPLATFITRMELTDPDLPKIKREFEDLQAAFKALNDQLFATRCRHCSEDVSVKWFEYSHVANCKKCTSNFEIIKAKKAGPGVWHCTSCDEPSRFSPTADSICELVTIFYNCEKCGIEELVTPELTDHQRRDAVECELRSAEASGLVGAPRSRGGDVA